MRRILTAVAAAWIALSPAREAAADPKTVCLEAADRAQTLRLSRHFVDARKALLVCADDACPVVVRSDCGAWLGEVNGSLPTVVLSVRNAQGREEKLARVSVDGVLFAERLDGSAQEIDPGSHVFLVEPPGGEAYSEEVVVHEGEKNRLLVFTRAAGDPLTSPPPAPPRREAPPPKAAAARGGLPTSTWIFGGLAVLGGGGFAGLWLDAVQRANHVRDTCEPHCSTADVGGIRAEAVFADVSLGVGVAAALAAIGVVVFRPASPGTAAVVLHPELGGASLGFARAW
jgi:hypothetical protein